MEFYLINHAKIRREKISGKLVTLHNVQIGLQVKRGLHWRKTWRDDIDTNDTNIPKKRLFGTIIGYTNNIGQLVGKNSTSIYDTDKITKKTGSAWAVVKWYNNKESVYPIGAEKLYSLVIAE